MNPIASWIVGVIQRTIKTELENQLEPLIDRKLAPVNEQLREIEPLIDRKLAPVNEQLREIEPLIDRKLYQFEMKSSIIGELSTRPV